jgi:branched-chain amino acid transport system permease protein
MTIDFFDSHQVLIQATFTSILLVLSLQVPFRMGVLSFAGVGCYGIGQYTTGILILQHQWPTASAIVAAVLVSALVALALALLLYRLNGLYLAMATFAFDLIVVVVATNGGDLTGGALGLYGVLGTPQLTLTPVVIATAVVLLIIAGTERGKTARRIEAVCTDPELAYSVGIRVPLYRISAFLVSGMLGGLAGSFNILFTTTVGPESIGFSLTVLVLTMAVVGGSRSWVGAVIGATIFTWLPTLLGSVNEWRAIVYGVVVTLVAVWMPGGIVGTWTKVWRAVEQQRRPPTAREGAGSASVQRAEKADLSERAIEEVLGG